MNHDLENACEQLDAACFTGDFLHSESNREYVGRWQRALDAHDNEVCGQDKVPHALAAKGWRCTRASGHDGPCAAVKD